MPLLAALALIVLMLSTVKVFMDTVAAGIRGEAAPVPLLRPVSRLITAKTEMLDLDGEYRELVSK